MSNDLQTILGYFMMIDYDKLRQFFALSPYGGSERVK